MMNKFEAGKALGYTAAGYGTVEVAGSPEFRDSIQGAAQDIAGPDVNVNTLEGTELGDAVENILEIGVEKVAPVLLTFAIAYIVIKKGVEYVKSKR